MNQIVSRYNSVEDLKSDIEKQIVEIEETIKHLSNIIGEKIRQNEQEFAADSEFLAFKEKIETKDEQNTKKKPVKKQKNGIWYDVENIQIYNGIGVKGELEVYFKGMEELKNQREELIKTKNNLIAIIEKGLKSDLGCIVYRNQEKPIQLALLKSTRAKKFSFKTSFEVVPEVLTR